MNALVCIALSLVAAEPIPQGKSRLTVSAGEAAVELFAYKPKGASGGPLIMVFHGVKRNAEEYRDHAVAMADRHNAILAAPRFDEERFPTAKYQQGGLLADGKVLPREQWTFACVPRIVAELRAREGRSDMPYYLIGHSGGGQFVARLAGCLELDARGLVAANPGTNLFPSRSQQYPYGFGGLDGPFADEAALKRYIEQPLTIYLGTADTARDPNLDVSPQADSQGRNRYERGRNAFTAARRLAEENGWTCRWRLVEAPDVPHDHELMFNHEACRRALFGD
jgi:poly(3-hydroxybutyrate) depolymerase